MTIHDDNPDARAAHELGRNLCRAGSPPARGRFSGAGPYEIAQHHAAGDITREQLLDELGHWKYEPDSNPTDGYDTLIISAPGSFEDVGRAYDDGLIDAQLYDEILEDASRPAD